MKIDVEQDGFNRTLNFRFNFNDGEENNHNAYFFSNPLLMRTPNSSKGSIYIVCEDGGEEVFIGIGSEQQYLKLCEIINEINSNV